MIEKILRTTDGKIKVKIPTVLNEITLGQMIAMQQKHYMDDLEAISILSGIPKEELYTVININDFEVFGDYVQSLAHQIKYLYNSDIVPHKVTFILGKRKVTLNVIHNLSVEPAGAFLAARDIIADEINEHINLYGEDDWQEHFQPSLKACCNVLAQYFFCRATGKKYDEYEAEEFTEEIKKLRVTEAMPIAKHFFSCYPDLLKQKIGFFQRLHQYWRRRQVFRRLKNLNT
jgi:hypothetical protein